MCLFTFTIKTLTYAYVPAGLVILRILHQSFEIERPKSHWSEVVVHLYTQLELTRGAAGSSLTGGIVLCRARHLYPLLSTSSTWKTRID